MQIHELPEFTGDATTEELAIDNGGNTMRISANALAKSAIETYNGSTIGGSAQTVQTLLDTLNSRTKHLSTGSNATYSSKSFAATDTSNAVDREVSALNSLATVRIQAAANGNANITGAAAGGSETTLFSYNGSQLNAGAPFYAFTFDTTARPVVCGTASDGNRIKRFSAVSTGMRCYAQWGTTGDTDYNYKTFVESSSDKRLKENIKPSKVKALDLIKKIKIREFFRKDRNKQYNIGFVADELEELDPMLSIGGEKDEDGNEGMKAVDTFYLQGYEVKAIQELAERVEYLEAKLAEVMKQ